MRSAVWGLLLMLAACTKMCGDAKDDLSPEQVVEKYLEIALNMTSLEQRDALAYYTTGAIRASLDSATPRAITEAYIAKKYKLERYSVVERRDRTPRETEITFELTYKDLGGSADGMSDSAATVTTESIVSVVRTQERWRIAEVVGKKSSFDFPVSQAVEVKPEK